MTSNLSGAWDRFWGIVTGSSGVDTLFTILAIAGMLLIVGAVVKFLWEKRRGGGGNSQAMVWSIIAGGVLAGPSLLIPLVLRIVDFVINLVAALLRNV